MKKYLLLSCLASVVSFGFAGEIPQFIGATKYGVRPGHEVIWRVPMVHCETVTATFLPDGIHFDPTTRTLRGVLPKEGEYTVRLEASNEKGTVSETLTICVGEQLCLSPPMGWNSWYSYSEAVSQAAVEKVAQQLETSGLAAYGWTFVNIDDCWQGERNTAGVLQPNEKFPDMAGLCRQLHARGLKVGLYASPWISTYAGFRGNSSDVEETDLLPEAERLQPGQVYGRYPGLHHRKKDRIGAQWHFAQDAQQWADWGFDYVKVDWKPNDLPTTQRIVDALQACDRDIVLSLSNNAPFENAAGLSRLANLWRTTGDITDTWQSIKTIGRMQLKWIPFQTPGHWNDPDILQIGKLGRPNRPNHQFVQTRLTFPEQHYHMLLWCMLSAPLFISCDLEALDAPTKSLLTDPELIALNQRYAHCPVQILEATENFFVLLKPFSEAMEKGAFAVFNDSDQTLQFSQETLKLPSVVKGPVEPFLLPPHSARLFFF